MPILLYRSINDAIRLAKAGALALSCLLPGGLATAQNAAASGNWPEIRFAAESLEYGDTRLSDVVAGLGADGSYRLSFGRLEGAGERFAEEGLTLEGTIEELDFGSDSLRLRATLGARGLMGELSVLSRADGLEVEVAVDDQPVAPLLEFDGLPPQLGWMGNGTFGFGLAWVEKPDQPPQATVRLAIRQVSFDSPDGRFAGAALALSVRGTAGGSAGGGDLATWRVEGAIESGELLADDFYRSFDDGGLNFEATARWDDPVLDVRPLRVHDDKALQFEGAAKLGSGDGSWSLDVDRLALQFPFAYRRYLESTAAAWTLDGLEVTGSIEWSGALSAEGLRSGDLDIRDLTIVDTRRRRFALTGLDTQLRPGDFAFDSRLAWRGLILGRINLGAGEAALDSEPGTFALTEPLMLDVLGGRLGLQRLKVTLPGGGAAGNEPDIEMQARIDEVDMAQLTSAFGWPPFSGRVSGEIPGVSLEEGVLEVDGEIRVNIFDGLVTLRNLRMERPFGVLPSLAGDLGVDNLDLGQLTQTFSFGHISGRLDGYVRDLRMLDWKPVAFDAWLGTPTDQEKTNDISRQAVNNLTNIGGGPVTAALASPLMRMFSKFSYRRLGLGCRLQNYVCELRGLDSDPDSVLIMEGAGIPKITIRAYNRRIDWPQMVANLLAVSAGEGIRVGEESGP